MPLFVYKVAKGRKKWGKEPNGISISRSGGHYARRQGARRYPDASPCSAAAVRQVAGSHRASRWLRAYLSGNRLGAGARESRHLSELRPHGELVEALAPRLRGAR